MNSFPADDDADEPARLLHSDVVFNLRDLGGYRAADGRTVRWRTVLRGDGVHRLPTGDITAMKIRTVLDLRTADEIVERGRAEAPGLHWYHLPVLRTVWQGEWFTGGMTPERFLADRYLVMLDEGADSLATALRVLGDPKAVPAVFHCAAGKDRTGVLASIVLGLLGVDDETIAADYHLSRAGMDRMVEFIRHTHPERYEAMADQPAAFLDAPAGAMELLLADVRQGWGSVEGYTESIGAGPDVVEALRANLLR
jgi:protein-tyrosine phosphatase